MNFLPMRYYLSVVKEGGISRAAERLHITQQTLSAHIAALEKELGCPLFERRPRFRLTYAGRVFQDYARQFSELDRAMRREFADISGEEQGELSVGVAYTRGRFLLTPFLPAFRRAHPHIRLRLVEAPNEELIARLLSDQVDLILAELTEEHPLIAAEPFHDEEMLLLVPDHLIPPRQRGNLLRGDLRPLADCPFLMNRQEDIAGRIGNALLQKHGLVPRVAVSSENMETLLDLCLLGEGACFCPRTLAERSFEGKDLSHLLQIEPGVSFSIRAAWLKKPHIPRALSDFVRLLRGGAKKKAAHGDRTKNTLDT